MLKLIQAAATKPVELEAFKAHARIVDDDENDTLELYLDAAAEYVAHNCQLVLAPALYRAERADFWSGCFSILVAPVRDIGSVKYYDAANVLQTVAEDQYGWRRTPWGAELEFLSGFTIPAVYDRDDAVQVEILAGFENPAATGSGDPEVVLPKRIAQAVLLIASHWNEHRESVDPVAMHTLPMAADSIMAQLRVWR